LRLSRAETAELKVRCLERELREFGITPPTVFVEDGTIYFELKGKP